MSASELNLRRVATCALLVALVGAASCTRSVSGGTGTPSGQPPAADSTHAPPGGAASLDLHTYGWEVGRRYAHPFKLTSAFAFGAAQAAFDFDLEGTLEIITVDATPESATLYLAIRNAHVASRVPGSQPEFDKIAGQLGKSGHFFTMSGGRLLEMRTVKGLSAMAVNIYRELASNLQFSRPIRSSEQYSAEECDTTGRYVAEYELEPARNVWHRSKKRYVGILLDKSRTARSQMPVVPQIVGSESEVELTEKGRPSALRSRNEVLLDGAQVPVHSTTTLVLEQGVEEAAPAAPNWDALLSTTERTKADEPFAGQAAIESLDDARIQGQTFESMVAQLERHAKGEAPRAGEETDDSKIFVGLAAMFRRKPETIKEAVRRIRAKSPAASSLIGALGSASSPQTQAALIDLRNAKELNAELRTRTMSALIRTPKPTGQSIALLQAILAQEPFDMTALYGLGSYTRRLTEGGKSDEAAVLGNLLLDRLAAAGQEEALLVIVLRAITNSGYAPALSKVSPFLKDERENVRAAAVGALQAMRAPQIDGLLADRISSDPSPQVRISAMDAAQIRDESAQVTRAVIDTALSADDPHVRYRAVELMTQWLPQQPRLRDTLDKISRSDKETRIREKAASP